MYPILLELGPFTILSLWLCVAIGFFTALLIVNKLVQKARLSLSFLADGSLWLFLGGVFVSRLAYVTTHSSPLEFFNIWDRGFSPLGGIIGLVLVLIILCRRKKENVLQWLDIISIGILGGLTWSNVGAFLDGSNSGTPTELPWGILLQNSIYAVPIHPVQLYAAFYCLILTVVFYIAFTKKWNKIHGLTMICALGSYSFFRFLEEFFRGDETPTFFGIREGFIFSLVGIIVSGILWYLIFLRKKQIDRPAEI